jgi:two-component system chemotaxis response regulator CheY
MKNAHVLVVDDAPEVRKLIRAVLWEMGIKAVNEASNGQEALNLLRRSHASDKKETRKYDLVLCDLHMPKMDGISFLKEARKMDEDRGLPVIMISVDSAPERIVEAVQSGADDFITKPYTVKTIEQKVRRALGRRKS